MDSDLFSTAAPLSTLYTTADSSFFKASEKLVKSMIGENKNIYMDQVAGRWHRWKHGHDLLNTFSGASKAGGANAYLKHLGTDLFTKDGLPIPGFSKSLLGQKAVNNLTKLGVDSPTRWLNMNGFDWLFGSLSSIETGQDLYNSFNINPASIDLYDYIDTFGGGAFDLFLGYQTGNPIFILSGLGEMASGLVLTYRDLTYVEPTFFEQLIENIPSLGETASAAGIYVAINVMSELVKNKSLQGLDLNDITNKSVIQTAKYVVIKTLINAITPALTGPGGVLSSMAIVAASNFLMTRVIRRFKSTGMTAQEAWSYSMTDNPWSNYLQDNPWNNDLQGKVWSNDLQDNPWNNDLHDNPWNKAIKSSVL